MNVSLVEVFSMLLNTISEFFNIAFSRFFIGDWALLIFGIVIFAIFSRLILAPLFGVALSAGLSDTVKRVQNEIKTDAIAREGEKLDSYDERWLM